MKARSRMETRPRIFPAENEDSAEDEDSIENENPIEDEDSIQAEKWRLERVTINVLGSKLVSLLIASYSGVWAHRMRY